MGNLYDPRYDRSLLERIIDAYDNPYLVSITMVLIVLILMLITSLVVTHRDRNSGVRS